VLIDSRESLIKVKVQENLLLDLLHKSKNDQFIGRFLYQTIRRFRLLLFHELLKSKNTVKQPV